MADKFPLAIVIGTVDKTTNGFDKVSSKLDKIQKKVGAAGKSMTRNLTLPIVGVGVASVKAAADFEKGMSNVSTLVDTNTESMKDMGDEVLAISRRTPVALGDITSALFDVRSAGISSADAMGVLENSAKLGVAGLGSTAEAADLVTSSLNAFGLEGEKAEAVYDQIFKTTKNGKTTIAELSQGFGSVAGIVANSGTELDEYLASVAALTTTGAPASKAHTQLKAVISGLTRETKQSSKVFKELGAKNFKDLIQQSGGLVPALGKITTQLKGDDAAILKLVGSTEAMGAVLGLTGGQSEAFTTTLANMRDGSNEAEKAFQKQNKTSAAQWQRTKNSLQSAAISIGTILAPALEKVAAKLQEAVKWFSNLSDSQKETIVKIAGIVAVVGPSLIVIGKLAGVIRAVTLATKLLSKAILANPLGILIGGLIAIKELTGDSWSTLFTDAIEFWEEALQEFFGWVEGKIKTVQTAIDDVVAYATGSETSAEKQQQENKNQAIRDEFKIRTDAIRFNAASMKREAAADQAWEALQARQALETRPGFDATASPNPIDGRMVIEFQNAPDNVRVKSMKGADAIDVKTGFQGI